MKLAIENRIKSSEMIDSIARQAPIIPINSPLDDSGIKMQNLTLLYDPIL